MKPMPTPTEIAVKEARQNERLKVLLMAKDAENLESLISTLEALINQD